MSGTQANIPLTIDLNLHRSPGIICFTGDDRARAIVESYDKGRDPETTEIELRVPDDVLVLSSSFRAWMRERFEHGRAIRCGQVMLEW